MKSALKLLAFIILSLSFAMSQTANLTANVRTIAGVGSNGAGVKVRFELRSNDANGKTQLGCGPGNIPRVPGVGPLDDTNFDYTVSNTGALTGSPLVYRNDGSTGIDCGGGNFVSYYWVYIIKSGQKNYYGQFRVDSTTIVTGTFNLNTAAQAVVSGLTMTTSGFVDLTSLQNITGQKTMSALVLSTYHVSTLPTASTVSGVSAYVDDSLTAGSCTTGGGSFVSLCRSNGTIWSGFNGSGLFVDLTTNQTISGNKTFSNAIIATGGVTASAGITSSSGANSFAGTVSTGALTAASAVVTAGLTSATLGTGAITSTSETASGTISGGTLTDSLISITSGHIERAGANVELQFGATASSKVRIGGNGSNPTTIDANTGAITATGSYTSTNGNLTLTNGQITAGSTIHSGGSVTASGGVAANGTVSGNDATFTSNMTAGGVVQNGSTATFDALALKAKRFTSERATAVVAGDFALSGGWGTTASVGSVVGHDSAFAFTITSSGTGQAANPTITFTFHDGTWTNAPICTATIFNIGSNTAPGTLANTTESATAPVFTNNTFTPVAAQTYRVTGRCEGR